MTDETRAQMADHGLTVLLTADYQAVLLQLARLAQFERLVAAAAEKSPVLSIALHHIRKKQEEMAEMEGI